MRRSVSSLTARNTFETLLLRRRLLTEMLMVTVRHMFSGSVCFLTRSDRGFSFSSIPFSISWRSWYICIMSSGCMYASKPPTESPFWGSMSPVTLVTHRLFTSTTRMLMPDISCAACAMVRNSFFSSSMSLPRCELSMTKTTMSANTMRMAMAMVYATLTGCS